MERPTPPVPEPETDNLYLRFAESEREEKTKLRLSLVAAVAIHAVLLAITFPELASRELAPPEEQTVFVVQTPKFKQPPPPPEQLPELRSRRVPHPDPTPDDPEPLPRAAPEPAFDVAEIDPIAFGIPDRPPEPDPPSIVTAGVEVEKPVRVHYVAPRYTEIARRARIEGVVIVGAIIDKAGRVTDVKVLKGLPMGLSEAAVEAVGQWRFRPSVLRGKPVAVRYNVTVEFQLN